MPMMSEAMMKEETKQPTLSASNNQKSTHAFLHAMEIALFALLGAVIATIIYPVMKAYKSIQNILNGKKIERSALRLTGIFLGGLLGIFAGHFIGAIFGFFIPVIGSIAGFTIGTILSYRGGFALGALASKYALRYYSYRQHKDNPDVLNPTNPEKWNLSHEQITTLEKKGFNVASIKQAMKQVWEKKQSLPFQASLPFTEESKEKLALNMWLEKLKSGDISKDEEVYDSLSRSSFPVS